MPLNLAVASARTCYSSRGIISPTEVATDAKKKALRDKIAQSTREAGHLTTRQHAHFVFSLDQVSRSFLWSFLHSHPFYNSEQVSQRYVEVKEGTFTIPILPGKEEALFKNCLQLQMAAYRELNQLLLPWAEAEYFRIFPYRKKDREKWLKVIHKKTYEIARYILPIGTQAYLYHTVSALTLLRYAKICEHFDVPTESRWVVQKMIAEVLKIDPDFAMDLEDPIPFESTYEFELTSSLAKPQFTPEFIREFDESLGAFRSRLIDWKDHPEKTLAQAVRTILGLPYHQLSDQAAIELALNPEKNKYLGDVLNVSTLSKITRALHHVHFTFRKKISHTADSQDQRHRMIPASRPILLLHYREEPDYIVPALISEVPAALSLYRKTMGSIFTTINTLLNSGIPFEKAHYLLPNAFPIRYEESGDLLYLHHKWKIRTCYNTQEEIFFTCVDELRQLEQRSPEIARWIAAPCFIRKLARQTPYCPEGDRYCGVPVWNYQIQEYQRLI